MLSWDANREPNVAGYHLHCGTTSGVYTQQIETGNATTTLISNLVEGATYFFAVSAYNTSFVESPPSNEISYTVPSTTPPPLPTPTPTPTPTPAPTATPTPTPAPTATPTPTPRPRPTPTPRPSPTPASVQPTPRPTVTPFPTPTRASSSRQRISVSAAPTRVNEGEIATFTVTASSLNGNSPTIVNYTMKGKAVFGERYTLTGPEGQIRIPAGESSATVTLRALRTDLPRRVEIARMILQPGTDYKVAKRKHKASVIITAH